MRLPKTLLILVFVAVIALSVAYGRTEGFGAYWGLLLPTPTSNDSRTGIIVGLVTATAVVGGILFFMLK